MCLELVNEEVGDANFCDSDKTMYSNLPQKYHQASGGCRMKSISPPNVNRKILGIKQHNLTVGQYPSNVEE
jgi:hypothetical protein